MKKSLLPMVVAALFLFGCSHQYTMKLSNGRAITTASKPKLEKGYYHFKDASGKEVVVPQGRVREIEPASMTEEEKKPYKQQAPYPKKHKWYTLWLF
jgi:hypothetical protein